MGKLFILGRELAGAWCARANGLLLRLMIRLWRMAKGPDVSLMDTVKLCHLCEMGQQDTDSGWIPQPGMTLRDAEIIWDVAGEVGVEDHF